MASVAKLPLPPKAGTIHWFNDCIARSQTGKVCEEVTLTPGLANIILDANQDNRHVRDNLTAHYTADMASGRWADNGEPIIISNTGQVNDGQHRLMAVIDANVSIPMLFVFGPSFESRLTTDQGGAKTAGDYLTMEGVKNANIAAAVATIIMSLEGSEYRITKDRFLTKAQIRARVKSDEEISKAAHYVTTVQSYTRGLIPPAIIGACYYLFADIDAADAKAYLDQVCIGENIKRGDPAFAVRTALKGLTSLDRLARLEVVCRGWVAYRAGRKLMLAKNFGTLPALF